MPQGSRNPQGGGRFPALRGQMMVDSTRGSLRIRAWPKARPGRRHPTNEFWTQWLKAVTWLYRYQPATIQWQLQEATKGTVWMPRDVFIAAVRGRAWQLQDERGRKYNPMAFVQDVSDSLDAIAQIPGQMLFRGTDLWVPVPGGLPGRYLAYVSDSDPPEWVPPPSGTYQRVRIMGGNISQLVVNVNSTTYITTTFLQFTFDLDEMPFNQFRIMCYGGANQAGQTCTWQLSQAASPTVPLSAAGNDLVIPTATAMYDSNWIGVPSPPAGMNRLSLSVKGSNSTVDILTNILEIHFRVV